MQWWGLDYTLKEIVVQHLKIVYPCTIFNTSFANAKHRNAKITAIRGGIYGSIIKKVGIQVEAHGRNSAARYNVEFCQACAWWKHRLFVRRVSYPDIRVGGCWLYALFQADALQTHWNSAVSKSDSPSALADMINHFLTEQADRLGFLEVSSYVW